MSTLEETDVDPDSLVNEYICGVDVSVAGCNRRCSIDLYVVRQTESMLYSLDIKEAREEVKYFHCNITIGALTMCNIKIS